MGKPFQAANIINYDEILDEYVTLWSTAWPASSPTNQAVVPYLVKFFKKYLESWFILDSYKDLVLSVQHTRPGALSCQITSCGLLTTYCVEIKLTFIYLFLPKFLL